ncbi:MAG: hypothetical protein WBM74_07805, partial [Polyangiales bacterium]
GDNSNPKVRRRQPGRPVMSKKPSAQTQSTAIKERISISCSGEPLFGAHIKTLGSFFRLCHE